MVIFRMSILYEKERIEIFDRLLDEKQWVGFANPAGRLKPPGKRKSPAKTRRR
jgi:hypothetical protein